jgi:hypothetical protein
LEIKGVDRQGLMGARPRESGEGGGIYHNVSREYLHRYLWQWDFCWNRRDMNDGERTVAAIHAAEGKRLIYKQPTD